MLLLVFGILTAISLILVALGFFVDVPVYSTIGFFFLFLLGFSLQGGGITATDQTNETYSYVANSSQINKIVIVQNQTPLNDQNTIWIGRYLAIASGTAFVLVLTQWKKGNVRK